MKYTTEEFIKRSKIIHNNKYNYNLVKFINNKTKVKIICPIHGVFKQIPYSHLKGHGCKRCAEQEKANNKKYSTNEWIQKVNKLHNNKYDYSLVEYKNSNTKIKIICPIHGVFEQMAGNHLQGQGCFKCKNEQQSINNRKPQEQFIKEAQQIHNNKYDYGLVKYIGKKNKIKIICLKHGIFEQRAGDHLHGHGCPKCQNSKGEEQIEKILIENNIHFISQYKFNDCKNKRKLPFDFYLPEYNTCIEYQGEQHFKPKFGEKSLEQIQFTDKIKKEYCIKNNIKLIEIRYDEIINLNL
ncbi:MAG: hypothetical protein LBF97_03485 [Elusimicrobiota bacterium]|jgi:hypothetical protein|nr:hypothetical protein [Elusimicrobiota bacterium]